MGTMRDSFVCDIILQFYCENCMQNWFYMYTCTHTVLFAQKPFKNHRQSFHINDDNNENILFAAHNLMVNFHFSAFRLWFYTHCGFYVSTLSGERIHTLGHNVFDFSLLLLQCKCNSYGAQNANTLSYVRFYFNIYF